VPGSGALVEIKYRRRCNYGNGKMEAGERPGPLETVPGDGEYGAVF
jgi:hypothetical protein